MQCGEARQPILEQLKVLIAITITTNGERERSRLIDCFNFNNALGLN